jgi:hypothetical protein
LIHLHVAKFEFHRSAELGAIGLVMSGLAFAGMIGVAEIINHSGGFLKKGSAADVQVLENRKFTVGNESKSKRSLFSHFISASQKVRPFHKICFVFVTK